MKSKHLSISIAIVFFGSILITACSPGVVLGAEAEIVPKPNLEIVTEAPVDVESDPTEASGPEQVKTEPEIAVEPVPEADIRPASWSDETHSKSADPNFDVVFPQDEVNRLDITIDPDDWAAMMADMTSIYGEFGAMPQRGQARAGGGLQPRNGGGQGELLNPPAEDAGPQGGFNPGGGFGGSKEGDEYNPIWVPATVEFDADVWEYVGIRFKGNSSLMSSWRSGNLKLPLKLDFDEFEDDYPEIDDQRFYGFKQLTLSSNFKDNSFLREKIAADIFRAAGVPAAHTAFYEVYVDYGADPVYFGLYTLVEVVDDTVIEEQFSDDNGNLYKPSGQGASFATGSFDTEFFDKETNEAEADWSDIEALYRVLHTDLRTSNPAQWRAEIESIFDVDGFLNWLAVNTVIQNWDTYGIMYHNYYLYTNPETGLLTWIPWDNNEAMQVRQQRGMLSLSLDEVTAEWPLIRYLLDDPVYQAKYGDYVAMVISGTFNPDEVKVKYQDLHDLVAPYVVGPNGEIAGYTHLINEAAFEHSVAELIQHAESRYKAVQAYLQTVE
jgi:spore coat protein H